MKKFLGTPDMKYTLAAIACFALAFALPGRANATDFSPGFQVSQIGDLEKTCSEISQEVSDMELLINHTQKTLDDSEMTNHGVTVAKTVGSYLVGSLAGGIGIIAAGYIVSEAADDRFENAAAVQDVAEQRRSFMAGIYNTRGCMGPLEKKLADIETPAGDEDADTPEPKQREPRYND